MSSSRAFQFRRAVQEKQAWPTSYKSIPLLKLQSVILATVYGGLWGSFRMKGSSCERRKKPTSDL